MAGEGHPRRRSLAWLAALVVAGLVIVLAVYFLRRGAAPEPPHDEQYDRVLALTVAPGKVPRLPTLAPAFTAEQTRSLRRGFSWQEFPLLPERDAAGRPTLYYTALYVSERWQVDYFSQIALHRAFVPLFAEERERWRGQSGYLDLEGDGEGVFLFAFAPGALLNRLREAALAGEPSVAAAVLRRPPLAEAVAHDGALSYDYLAADGFLYAGLEPPRAAERRGAGAGSASRLGWLASPAHASPSRILRAAVSPVEDLIDETRVFFGELDRAAAGSAKIRVTVRAMLTDPDFDAGPLVRAWGPDRFPADPAAPVFGEPIRLRRTRIQSHKGASLFRGLTNSFGVASFDVAKGEQNLCVELSNPAAEVTNGLTALVLCNFNDPTNTDLNLDIQNDLSILMQVRDNRMNVFAQLQDGHDYATRVIGRSPRQARAAVGGLHADLVGALNGQRAFAPCLGNSLDFSLMLLSVIQATGPPPLSTLTADVDLVFPEKGFLDPAPSDVDRGNLDPSSLSRAVPTHEYGHFVLCDLMHQVNAAKFHEQWLNIIFNVGNETAGAQINYLNEAFADFFTLQLVGGTNYARLNSGAAVGAMTYCPAVPGSASRDPLTDPFRDCAEDNVGGPALPGNPGEDIAGTGDYRYQIARMVSILHDAFDGEAGFSRRFDYGPSVGAAFSRNPASGNLGSPLRAVTGVDDESIVLAGSDVERIVRHLFDHAQTLDERNLFNALSRTMVERGFSAAQICQLFELHLGSTQARVPPQPDVRVYRSCADMVDAEALDTTDIPPARTPAIRVLRDPETPGLVGFLWSNFSPIAARSLFGLTNDAGFERSTTLPFRRTNERFESALPADTAFEVTVQTINGDHRTSTAARFVTYARPPTSVAASPTAGGARIAWTADEPASAYAVWMLSPRRQVVLTTSGREAVVRGLLDGTDHRFGVAALNQAGEPSQIVPASSSVRPAPTVAVFASPNGNDSHVLAGTREHPFASLRLAAEAAQTRGADALYLYEGEFTVGDGAPLRIDRDLEIRGGVIPREGGGFDYDGWTLITFTTAGPAGNVPSSRLFNGRWRELDAALAIGPDADVALSNLEIVGTAAPRGSSCLAVVGSAGNLTLDAVMLTARPPRLDEGGCHAALAARGGVIRMSTAEITGADLSDLSNRVGAVDLAGVATQGSQLHLSNSIIHGVSNVPDELLGPRIRVAGVTGRALGPTTVSRSTVRTAVAGWAHPLGRFAGLDASILSSFHADNSVLWSAAVGNESIALDLQGVGPPAPGVFLVHNTLIAGDLWTLNATTPAGFVGAALRVSGTLDTLEMINTIFSYAAGTRERSQRDPGARWAGVDLSGTRRVDSESGRRFHNLTSRGNLFSVPIHANDPAAARVAGNDATLIFCAATDFGRVVAPRNLQNPASYNCGGLASSAGWLAADNTALVLVPYAGAVDTPSVRYTLAFLPNGHARAVFAGLPWSEATLRASGVALQAVRRQTAAVDRGGTARDAARARGAGAWIVP